MSKLAPTFATSLALAIGLALIVGLASPVNAQLGPRSSSNLIAGDRPQPLSIEAAFPFYVSINQSNGLSISWQVAAGHYLYKQQFGFETKRSATRAAKQIAFTVPDGLKKTDQFFGAIEAYYGDVTATLDIDADALKGETLIIRFQGCADWGFCYPPQAREFAIQP